MSLGTLTSKRAGGHPHQFRARNLAPGVALAPDHLKEARDFNLLALCRRRNDQGRHEPALSHRFVGGDGRNRTADLRVMNPSL